MVEGRGGGWHRPQHPLELDWLDDAVLHCYRVELHSYASLTAPLSALSRPSSVRTPHHDNTVGQALLTR